MYKTFSSELRFIFYDFSKFKQYSEIIINYLKQHYPEQCGGDVSIMSR